MEVINAWHYEFEDGTVLDLVNAGLSIGEVLALTDLHGKCTKTDFRKVEVME